MPLDFSCELLSIDSRMEIYRSEVIYYGHFFTYPSCAHPQPVWVRKGEKKVCRIGLEFFGRTKGKCVKYPRKILKFSTYKNNNKNKLSRKFRHLANRWQCDNRAARAKFTVNSYFFPFENKEKKPTLMTIVVQRFGQKCTFSFSKIFTFGSS